MSFHPQTPQSPTQVSPATSSDPSSTVSTSMTTATATTLPTPAHSVTGSISQPDVIMADDSPQKRKRTLDDDGDREQKKVHLEEYRLGIEDLHLDVGQKYLLCQQPLPEQLPRTSDDLFELYDLTALAAELAREKPSGEKNALRKTYKGHIKRLGIAGHFDVQKRPENAPPEFLSMYYAPDEEWNVMWVKDKEIGAGLSEQSLSSLARATMMAKGPISRNLWDTSVLGDLTAGDGTKISTKPVTTPGTPVVSTPGPTLNRPKVQLPPGHDPTRPKRNVKKRSYGDSSFEGYGDGFPDDDAGADTGYSTGEDGSQKRRKKDGNASPYPNPLRHQNYGPGMVGV